MNISELVDVIGESGTRLVGSDNGIEISSVSMDSRAVEKGGLFCCVRGERFDGHDFASSAIESGAAALLVDHVIPGVSDSVLQVVVTDIRRSIGPVAARLAGDPSRHMTVVGITGTNGKTTTAHLLAAILRASGRKTEALGTLQGLHTTPEAPQLQSTLASMRNRQVDAVAMEVSSHALSFERVGNALRGSRVHQSEQRPSRFSRHDGELLLGEIAVVRFGTQ